MSHDILALKEGAHGVIGTPDNYTYCYTIDVDGIVKDGGVLDTTYRVKVENDEYTVTENGLPCIRLTIDHRTLKWNVTFFLEGTPEMTLQLYAESHASLKDYALSIKANDYFRSCVSDGPNRYAFFFFPFPHERSWIVSTLDHKSTIVLFEDGFEHPEAEYYIQFEDYQKNAIKPRQAMIIKGTDIEPAVRMASLYQIFVYMQFQQSHTDPQWTFDDMELIHVLPLKNSEIVAYRFLLERDENEQPKLLGRELFTEKHVS